MLVSINQIASPENAPDISSEFLFHEILNSMPVEIIQQLTSSGRTEFNVQLMIDNQLFEPQVLGDVLKKIGELIDGAAERRVRDRIEELDSQYARIFAPLEEAVHTATEKIKSDVIGTGSQTA